MEETKEIRDTPELGASAKQQLRTIIESAEEDDGGVDRKGRRLEQIARLPDEFADLLLQPKGVSMRPAEGARVSRLEAMLDDISMERIFVIETPKALVVFPLSTDSEGKYYRDKIPPVIRSNALARPGTVEVNVPDGTGFWSVVCKKQS